MQLLTAVREALHTIRVHPLRTALTMLCVAWGSAAVILLVSWGSGLAVMMEGSLEKVGHNMVWVWAGHVSEDFSPAADRRRLWFTPEDVTRLRARLRRGDLVVGECGFWLSAAYRQRTEQVEVRGVEAATMELRGVQIAAGRPIGRRDVERRARVAVLGVRARERLLGPEGGVGTTIRIEGRTFHVVGLLDRVGTQLWRGSQTEIDEQIWIPLPTLLTFPQARASELDTDVIQNIGVRVRSRGELEQAKAEIRAILAESLHVSPTDKEAIGMGSPLDLLATLRLDLMQGVLGTIAVMTLAIGASGVLNLMLESVFERRREIGVRLAVGGQRSQVISQFFCETLVITGIGGLLGVSLGIVLTWLLSLLEVPDLIPLPILEPWSIVLSVAILSLVGIVAGVVPAMRAAAIDPALTLRVDA